MLHKNEAEEFDNIAEEILNRYVLIAGGLSFRIAEIEFYLSSPNYPDPYVHCDPDQLTVAKWYFHKRGGTYRGGTFLGLDITFADNAYGGILLRTLIKADGTVIEGPCNCVRAILQATGQPTVSALADQINVNYDVFTSPVLRIAPCETRTNTVYTSTRVGLNLTKAPDYAAAPYRYISEPAKIKKERKNIIAGMKKFHALDDEDIKKLMR